MSLGISDAANRSLAAALWRQSRQMGGTVGAFRGGDRSRPGSLRPLRWDACRRAAGSRRSARGVLPRRSWRGPCTARWPGRRSRRHAGGGGRRTIFVAGGRASTPLKGRRHDRAHEQLVDPALGLDGGGEFLERDLVEAASRVAWLSGRSPRRSSKMVSVVTRPRSGPTNSTPPARRNGV